MNAARILILIVAALAAIAAAVFVRGAMQPAPAPAPVVVAPEPDLAQVLVAARDLSPGERVSAGDMRWAPWPEEAVLASFVAQGADPEAMERLAGAVVRTGLASGEPINPARLVQPGQAGFMAAVVSPGMRAVAVPTSARAGAGGFILPNDRVDLIATRDTLDDGFESDLIVENVRVLAIDQTYAEDEDGAVVGSTATLELSPEQARIVALAVATGDVTLALRSVADGQGDSRLPDGDDRPSDSERMVRVFRYGEETRVALGGAP